MFVLVRFHHFSPYWLTSAVLSESVFKQPMYKSFFVQNWISDHLHATSWKTISRPFNIYPAVSFYSRAGEIFQCTDSSSVHKRLIKPPSFALKIKNTLIWCKVCYLPKDWAHFSFSTQALGDENQSNAWFTELANTEERKNSRSQVCHLLPESVCVMTMLCWILVQNTGVCTTTAAWLYNDILTPADSRGSTILWSVSCLGLISSRMRSLLSRT